MSVPSLPEASGGAPELCSLCGRAMVRDQEWCLECGSARTVIARAPDWRIPILVAAIALATVAGVVVFALGRFGAGGAHLAVVETARARRPLASVASWAPGLDGYTVILAVAPSEPAALGRARGLLGAHLAGVGVLDTAQHPQMTAPGLWEVFAGRYPSFDGARSAAAEFVRHGHPDARPVLVQRPGA